MYYVEILSILNLSFVVAADKMDVKGGTGLANNDACKYAQNVQQNTKHQNDLTISIYRLIVAAKSLDAVGGTALESKSPSKYIQLSKFTLLYHYKKRPSPN